MLTGFMLEHGTCCDLTNSALYSREVFDYETQRFDANKLLKAGLEFGGYDSVLLWYQYPRLGVDERKQWDFNRDIPGGMAGMRSFTQECHKQGVRVFLPYKPWDCLLYTSRCV